MLRQILVFIRTLFLLAWVPALGALMAIPFGIRPAIYSAATFEFFLLLLLLLGDRILIALHAGHPGASPGVRATFDAACGELGVMKDAYRLVIYPDLRVAAFAARHPFGRPSLCVSAGVLEMANEEELMAIFQGLIVRANAPGLFLDTAAAVLVGILGALIPKRQQGVGPFLFLWLCLVGAVARLTLSLFRGFTDAEIKIPRSVTLAMIRNRNALAPLGTGSRFCSGAWRLQLLGPGSASSFFLVS